MSRASVKVKEMRRGHPEDSRIPQAARVPHSQLRTMVTRRYAGYSEATHSFGCPVVLHATTAVQIVIGVGDTVFHPRSFLRGPKDAPLLLNIARDSSYLELWLNPLGAYSLLDTDGGADYRGRIIDFGDVAGPCGRNLSDKIRDESTWSARFDILEEFLLGRAERGRDVLPGVGKAWALLINSGGMMPIARIAEAVGWSHKHLITKFTQQIGLSPKTAARIIRFDRARHLLRKRPHSPLHEVAADCGYADHSHLDRDFRAFSGFTPSEYIVHFRNQSKDRCESPALKGNKARLS
ncbi:helix-turn-helix domain-containing protein [Nocardia sp. NPDC004168]|uniref:helix-turn-helix domain-containing protein n=1 Tax=Nocardia sp. NPDC004168 TaxID=3154452 RepID=UPI0033AF6B2F